MMTGFVLMGLLAKLFLLMSL